MTSRTAPRHVGLAALALLAASACRTGVAAPSEARALVARSIALHDPHGRWRREPVAFTWTGLGPDGAVRYRFDVVQSTDAFELVGERAGHSLEYRVAGDVVEARVDGSTDFDDDLREAVGLARDGGLLWRDYIGFLAGIPMCLADPGVVVASGVERLELDGRAVDAVRVVFDPEVGSDRWTFYFEPGTARVVGCRFDRPEPTKDGETIVFAGEAELGGLRLPRERRWTMNADGRFLGTEVVTPLGEGPAGSPPVDLSGWGTERIPFPPGFAPSLPAGMEVLLFAPGMFEVGAEDYWSYAFLIELDEPLEPDALAGFLETYYDGLIAAVASGNGVELDDPASVSVTRDGRAFTGQVELTDAFVTMEPLELRLELELAGRELRVRASPQPTDHPIWRELAAAVAALEL